VLAAAQAQHEVVALAQALTDRGADVSYGIHPRRPGNAVSEVPILDVDKAKSVIVIKRSLGHGYAGIDNELYTDPKTAMLFSDAKAGLTALLAGLAAYATHKSATGHAARPEGPSDSDSASIVIGYSR
jgi:NAD(P) transhydrogenase subunit beta